MIIAADWDVEDQLNQTSTNYNFIFTFYLTGWLYDGRQMLSKLSFSLTPSHWLEHFFYLNAILSYIRLLFVSGWLYDGTGSYDVSFIVAGVVVAISGVMLYFIPLVRRCLHKEKTEETLNEVEVRRASV